jgi:predicted dehydrogenase
MKISKTRSTRRDVLKSSIGFAGAAFLSNRAERAAGFTDANGRPRMGVIGSGSRWYIKATGVDGPHGTAPEMRQFGDYVAVCDADSKRRGLASEIVKGWTGKEPQCHLDYRAVLDDARVDIVHISTPDHWHAKIAIEAMLSGKDVYCEKPMTLTIEEGQKICEVCRKTGRIVQIGTQQRSDERFLRAIALIRAGRIGEVKKATCSIGAAPASPMLPSVDPPNGLDWNLWLGPAPQADFRYLAGENGETKSWSRCHYEFRWWYEYSGGKLTDWGAHHVDIATWGLNKTATGPISVDPVLVKHPVEFNEGYPVDNSQYNTATEFLIKAVFEDDAEIEIRHDQSNGILFEGTNGRIFVNRGRLTGTPVDELASNPLPNRALEEVYKNRSLVDHFRNFFEAVADRKEPISDVFSHHRALSTCHLAGIAARLNRKIQWDPKAEQVIGDDQAQSFVGREQRKGFEIDVTA